MATGAVLPPPPERIRLRRAAGLTEAAVAQALKVRPASLTSWEAGRSEPAGEKFDAYRRLLEGLAAKFPAPAPPAPTAAPPTTGPAAPPSAARTAHCPPTDTQPRRSRQPGRPHSKSRPDPPRRNRHTHHRHRSRQRSALHQRPAAGPRR
ncbi:helix-turn-helix transcriptional regulator [Streptacidiphilus sp. P02-A3a]|uniref:helix-turn-helix domain-containing protein n=1 Tax=Streptacidiphilus sp. P02-A3a TaxID=2704468 RepID=UPI0015FC4986|nr:helix-turn-helix transcriptional regulator [Streptacidiphilus sp. P02-A3a]QMU70274.1 helix-turn-helix transcriptional regulator [Streptacidiphilus sp. P02-A3a]